MAFEKANFESDLEKVNRRILRVDTGKMCAHARNQLQCSRVGVIEQKGMVKSGVRGTKQERRPTSGLRWVVSDV